MVFVEPTPGLRDAARARIIMLDSSEQDRVANDNGYELRVFERSFDLTAAFEELEHLLDVLDRARKFPEISLLVKLYIIGWVSLSDILANLINEIFDLGYAERDVQLGMILRNRKICKGTIPEVIKKHGPHIKYDYYVRVRNDIVHRGQLPDPDFKDVRGEVVTAVVLKTMRVDQRDPAALARATRQAEAEIGAAEKIRDLVSRKRVAFADHLVATRSMLGDLTPVLVQRIQLQPKSAV